MKFIFADNLDYVDPAYDFLADRSLPGRKPYWDDLYPHEFMDEPPYHGVLVSRAILNDGPLGGGKYTPSQAQRFRREGARAFLRLDGPQFAHMPIFGDCGAFAYHRENTPPYSPEDMVTFYEDAGFTHGCSVDHIIFEFDEGLTSGLAGGSQEARRRFDITLANAESFLTASRRLSNRFTPLGVVQGWSPGSMAEAAKSLCKMGYRYLAVGGTVPLRTAQIKACLRAIRDVIPPDVDLHVLGFAKADDLSEFRPFRITSFDTTSPLLRAFKDEKTNYYLRRADGRLDYYTAIRVPQAIENTKLLRLVKRGARRQEDLLALETRALSALRAYDREETGLEEVLDAVMAYGTPAILGEKRMPPRPRRLRNCVRATDGRWAIVPGRHAPARFAAKYRSRSCSSVPATATRGVASTTWASLKHSSTTYRIWSPTTPMDNLTFSAVRARQIRRAWCCHLRLELPMFSALR